MKTTGNFWQRLKSWVGQRWPEGTPLPICSRCQQDGTTAKLIRSKVEPLTFWHARNADGDRMISMLTTSFCRASKAHLIARIKSRINKRLSNSLGAMKKPGYDDSIVGFIEAWDIVRKALDEAAAEVAGQDVEKER